MKKSKTIITLVAGILIGTTLAGPAASAAESWFKAMPSTQQFFVDGRKVQLEAYAIEGHNYVKLRDIGKVVDFSVSYGPMTNSVIVVSGMPYQDESEETISALILPTSAADYASQANPAVFTSGLTSVVYSGIRDSMAHREEIIAGSYEPLPLDGVTDPDGLVSLGVAIGMWPSYQFRRSTDVEVVCLPKYAEAWQAAADHCQPFIDSLVELSDREKVKRMDFYVCDRMTYAVKGASIGDILSQDGVVPSYCMNYSYCFKFLCDMADIPCILSNSATHM